MYEPILYTVRLPHPETHRIEVEARFPTGGRSKVDLMMPVWTPGSYLVREFARHVEVLAAATEAGEPLACQKISKNRWQVAARGLPRIVVRYRLYAREMSVRTDFVDAGFALLNGAATFLALAPETPEGKDGPDGGGDVGGIARPHLVCLVAPPRWRVAVSALPEAAGAPREGERLYQAESFEHLVDSPIYAGNAAVHRFEVARRPHLLVNEGEDPAVWDGPRSAADAERVVREHTAFWGSVPYSRYVFFNLITEGSGGLEHRDSSVLMTSRWRSRSREGRLDWLGLLSHELFHAWNAKRLRPAELADLDFEQEVYTRSLWQVEGVTSYYDDLLVHRAGLSTPGELLRQLSRQIELLETSPGRLVQSLEAASFDTWIQYYRRDENFANAGISYYTKGAVVSFLLDAAIRRATMGRRSLDTVLRRAFERYSGARGFRAGEFEETASEVAETDLGGWFDRAVRGTGDLAYEEALDWFGLRFGESEERGKRREANAAWLGLEAETQAGRLVVTQVKRGTPAYAAGVNVGDEILAIGDYRVPPDGLRERLAAYRSGEERTLLVARRERLERLPVVFGQRPRLRFRLEPDPAATPTQRAHRAAWLRPSAPGYHAGRRTDEGGATREGDAPTTP